MKIIEIVPTIIIFHLPSFPGDRNPCMYAYLNLYIPIYLYINKYIFTSISLKSSALDNLRSLALYYQ